MHDDRAACPWRRADGQGRIGERGGWRRDRDQGDHQVGRSGRAKLEADQTEGQTDHKKLNGGQAAEAGGSSGSEASDLHATPIVTDQETIGQLGR
ncbi:MAG TPA: hypothetical protein VF944_11940 [Candidatus Bathyarchaeia archaeon]